MSSNPITESYFIIVAVIAATILTAAIVPSIAQISQVYNQQAQNFQDKADLQLTIVFAAGVVGQRSATLWLKNTGVSALQPALINRSEIFFGITGNFSRVQYGSLGTDSWNYTILNESGNTNGNLNPGDTLQVLISLSRPLLSGDYYVQFVTYLGTTSDYTFST